MVRAVAALMFACLLLGPPAQAQESKKPGHYLFVWAQDRAKEGMDFLAVIDADPASPRYGKLVTSVATDQKSNNKNVNVNNNNNVNVDVNKKNNDKAVNNHLKNLSNR